MIRLTNANSRKMKKKKLAFIDGISQNFSPHFNSDRTSYPSFFRSTLPSANVFRMVCDYDNDIKGFYHKY